MFWRQRAEDGRALLAAAEHGDLAALVSLVTRGVNVNCTNDLQYTPLHWAAWEGHVDAARFLIGRNAAIDARTHSGRTPLSWAAENNKPEMVRLLLAANADDEIKDDEGRTPLMWSDAKGHVYIAQLLRAHACKKRQVLLLDALRQRDVPTALALLSIDSIDANLRDETGTPLLHVITAAESQPLLLALLEKPKLDLHARDTKGNTALACAVEHNDVATSMLLLQSDDRLALAVNNDGQLPLHVAAANGTHEIVTALVSADASLCQRCDARGNLPLHLAAAAGHSAIVATLLQHPTYCRIDAVNQAGETALSLATRGGHDDIVTVLQALSSNRPAATNELLQSSSPTLGANEANDNIGVGAAHVPNADTMSLVLAAVQADDASSLRALLHAPKLPRAAHRQISQSALVAAVQSDAVRVVMDLVQNSADHAVLVTPPTGPSPLHLAATLGSLALLGMLFARPSTNIDARNEEGFTALSMAVCNNRVDAALLLLRVGADVATPQHTPVLHSAVVHGDTTMLTAILTAPGLQLNQKDEDGYTALARAVVAGRDGVVARLLEAGANVWTCLPNGQTVLAASIARGHRRMAQALYARMYPFLEKIESAADMELGERLTQQGDVDLFRATYRGKAVVLKGPRLPLRRIVSQLRNEVLEMQECASPYVLPLVAVLDNGSTSPVVNLPDGNALYSPTMVLEYMEGGDLKTHLSKTSLGLDVPLRVSTLDVALVLAYALADLHRRNKVHRDVKSLNIFLSASHYIRLGDLGSARTLDDCMTSNVGTKLWIAPEVVRVGLGGNGPGYGPPADIYSFGVVLTELDTRETPYADVHDTNSIPDQVRDGKLRPKMSNNCAPWLQALADKCLAHDPACRPSAEDIITELLAHRQGDNLGIAPLDDTRGTRVA